MATVFVQNFAGCPLSRLNPSNFIMPPQRLMARVLVRTGVLPSISGGGGGSVICTVMERSIPLDIAEVTWLRVSGNSTLLAYTTVN